MPQEILDPWFSHGLDTILRAREWKLSGILNGIDTDSYNPETDPQISTAITPRRICRARRRTSALCRNGWTCPSGRRYRSSAWSPVWWRIRGWIWSNTCWMSCCRRISSLWCWAPATGRMRTSSGKCRSGIPDKFLYCHGFVPELARKIYAGDGYFPYAVQERALRPVSDGRLPLRHRAGGAGNRRPQGQHHRLRGRPGAMGFTFKTYNANDMLYAIRRSLGAYANKTDWPVLVRPCHARRISAGAVPPTNISSCTRR